MAFGLKDIVLAIKLVIDRASAVEAKNQIQAAIKDGTAPEDAEANLGRVEAAIQKITKRAGELAIAIVAALAGRELFKFVEESVMAFARFDQKMQQSIAIMGIAGKAMKKELGDTAREVAKELGISADEIVQGYYYLVSAGLSAAQAIKALPTAALFAKAGLMDMKQATDMLTLAVSALGYASKDPQKEMDSMSRVADVLALASKRSQTTLEQLTGALTNKAAQSLRIFHKDVEEGAAALMVLANAGVRGTVAGERLDIFMRQITSAAVKHADAFKKAGIAVFDAAGHMRSFADISHDLTAAMGHLDDKSVTVMMSQLGIQQRTQASVKVFIGAEDALRKYEAMMAKAGGTTLRISDEMMNTPAERWNKFKEKIADARREIGEGFIPALEDMSKHWGDENDPHSLVGMMKQFGEGVSKSDGFMKILGTTINDLVIVPIAALIDLFNIVDDIIVGTLQASFGVITGSLAFLGFMGVIAADGIAKLLHIFHLDGAAKVMEDFAGQIDKITVKLEKLTGKTFEAVGSNMDDLGARVKSWFEDTPAPSKKRLIDNKPKGKGGRDDKGGTDHVDPEDDEKAAQKKQNKIDALNNRLDEMLAKHTQTQTDDALQKLAELTKAYEKVYGKDLPDRVKAGLLAIRASIKGEGAAEALKQEWKDAGWNEEDTSAEKFASLQVFIQKLRDLKDGAKAGSKEWATYNDLLKKALDMIEKMAGKERKGDQSRQDKEEAEKEKAATARLRRIERITDHVAINMGKAFDRAFQALTTGSRRGIDALHALKDVALSALSAPLAAYAMNKAKEQFLEAGDDVAKGFSFLSNPLTAALAPGMFQAAAMHAAQGTAWSALSGGVSAVSAGLNSAGGAGHFADHGSGTVSNSTPRGPDINITIDGIDPRNATHQKLLADTIQQYAERGGGNLNITTKR